MSRELLQAYEKELEFIRKMAAEFGQQHKQVAGELLLVDQKGKSTDPHVERMIEAFALLTARVRLKLDDEFPELTDALFSILFPHYLAPLPSMAIVQFPLMPGAANLQKGFLIPRHSPVETDRPQTDRTGNLTQCKYRTAYDVTLWPVTVKSAVFRGPPFPDNIEAPSGTEAIIRLELWTTENQPFCELGLETLRFYLSGSDPVTATLHELIFNNLKCVGFRFYPHESDETKLIFCDRGVVQPVGYRPDEGLLPYPPHSFIGYRLLTEFFAYRKKFLFFDLSGISKARQQRAGKRLEVIFYLDQRPEGLDPIVSQKNFVLGCTPIINLFEHDITPFTLQNKKYEYFLNPLTSHPDDMEIFSVDEVVQVDATTQETIEYQPFYSYRHFEPERSRAYWYMSRRPSVRKDDKGTDVWLHLVDLDFHPRLPRTDLNVQVKTTCLNRDLPNQLRLLGEAVRFQLPQAAVIANVNTIEAPTSTRRPPLRKGSFWRLISHLTLNHLSLSVEREGWHALQEYLRLYDFGDPDSRDDDAQSTMAKQVIDGLLRLSTRPIIQFIGDQGNETPRGDMEGYEMTGSGFARGLEITVDLDRSKFIGIGAYLFASVLDRFFSMYASINSFTKLIAKVNGKDLFRPWPPRAGGRQLL